jgi:BirA family transcriptional regulator, biotin operon repressor / biotin---[acetyl-CoA-carboxylase] ligase
MIPPFYRLRLLDVTASTNADAGQAAEADEAEGLVIQALRQTAGRGRQGRTWDSPEGNLYASILLRPRCSLQEAGHYSFVTALAIYDAVRAFLPKANIKLKWPNDVLVNGKKISGALLEAAPVEQDVVAWLIVGIGINVLHHPENGLYPATSLAAEGVAQTESEAVLRGLLESLERWRLTLSREGFAPLRKAWLAHAQTGLLTARLPHETVEGAFQDLDERGNLILRLPDGAERAIAAGDVFFHS